MINEIETRHFMLANKMGFGIVIPKDCIFNDFDEKAIADSLNIGTGVAFISTLGQMLAYKVAPEYVDALLKDKELLDNKVIGVEYKLEVLEETMLRFERELKNSDFNTKLIKKIAYGLSAMGAAVSVRNDGQCTIIDKKTTKILAVTPNLVGALFFHEGMVSALRAKDSVAPEDVPAPIITVTVGPEEEDAKSDKSRQSRDTLLP